MNSMFLKSHQLFSPPLFLLSVLLYTQIALSSQATAFTGKTISVSDGDAITVINQQNEQIKIRLSGVDCPEGG